MPFENIQKLSTPQMVAEQILRRIESGELAAGQRLPAQRDLAERLGVGRSSIREAINALVVMGYLEVRHGSGTYVRADSPEVDASLQQLTAAFKAVSLLDLMEIREVLECQSAALAAERADSNHLRRLRRIMEQVEATHGDYHIFLKADIDFHACLAEATGNPVIEEMSKLILGKLVRHHQLLSTDKLSSHYREHSIRSAREVVRAVETANAAEAARWMKIHLDAIRAELKDILNP